jgi:hypothetical protein
MSDPLSDIGPEFFAGLELHAKDVARVIAPDELRLAISAEAAYDAHRHILGGGVTGSPDEQAWPRWESLPERVRAAWRASARATLRSLRETA